MALKIRFAVSAPAQGPDLREFAQRSEAAGFDTLWLSDIPLASSGDPLVTLTSMAACTDSIRLGTNLVPLGRNPMLLARQLAQIDQLSAGRLLLTLVPGIDQPHEREALGVGRANRGHVLDEVTGLLRRWWDGETVTHHSDRFAFTDITVLPAPVQDPLEIWFGGTGPVALDRVGRLGDGWLTAGIDAERAAAGVTAIVHSATAAGRVVDPEHFGISMPFARSAVSASARRAIEQRYPSQRFEAMVPVGADQLGARIVEYTDAGLSKFVLRQLDPGDADADMDWLAQSVLPLQT